MMREQIQARCVPMLYVDNLPAPGQGGGSDPVVALLNGLVSYWTSFGSEEPHHFFNDLGPAGFTFAPAQIAGVTFAAGVSPLDPPFGSASFNNVLAFAGRNDPLKLFLPNSDFTWCFWIRLDVGDNGAAVRYGNASTDVWSLTLPGTGTHQWTFQVNGVNGLASVASGYTVSPPDAFWTFFELSYEKGSATMRLRAFKGRHLGPFTTLPTFDSNVSAIVPGGLNLNAVAAPILRFGFGPIQGGLAMHVAQSGFWTRLLNDIERSVLTSAEFYDWQNIALELLWEGRRAQARASAAPTNPVVT